MVGVAGVLAEERGAELAKVEKPSLREVKRVALDAALDGEELAAPERVSLPLKSIIANL